MSLRLFITIAGWVMVAGPVLLFLFISFHMLKGLAQDDDLVLAVAMLNLAIFIIGGGLLVLTYFTNLIPAV
jgi:hypothetical protein